MKLHNLSLKINSKVVKINNSNHIWFKIALIFTIYYGLVSCYYGFSQDYLVQDDARQHVIWLQRFIDPELFPNDIIADYFIKLAPLGYKTIYWLGAKLGIAPAIFAKILPAILGLITTLYIYHFSYNIIPSESCAFFSSLFINQLMWLNDDLISATPRAFLYPIFAAFLYYLSQKEIFFCTLCIALQGLFYPQLVFIEITILTLRLFKPNTFLKLTTKQNPYTWWILGLITAAIALYPLTQKPPELATTFTAQEMKQMPEFNLYGRNSFFVPSFLGYWILGSRSGLSLPTFPLIFWTSFALPFILKTRLTITKLITPQIAILGQTVIASLLIFFTAHLLLPKLHLPSRYTYHSLRFIVALATAIVVTALLDLFWRWWQKTSQKKLFHKIVFALVNISTAVIIIFPMIPPIFIDGFQNWHLGKYPAIYQYLAQQPKHIMVASLTPEVNNIPAFSQRSILTGREFAISYHPYYHNLIQQRTTNLIQAQYSNHIADLQNFIRQYSVDFLLLDKNAFTSEYLRRQKWLIYSSWEEITRNAIDKLKSPDNLAISPYLKSCEVASQENLVLLDTNCLKK